MMIPKETPVNLENGKSIYTFILSMPNFFYLCRCNGTSGLPWWLSGKESICHCRRCRFDSWVGKIPWRRKWQASPVFLPGESHGEDLVIYSSWGHKRFGYDGVTEYAHTHLQIQDSNIFPEFNILTTYLYILVSHVLTLLCDQFQFSTLICLFFSKIFQ